MLSKQAENKRYYQAYHKVVPEESPCREILKTEVTARNHYADFPKVQILLFGAQYEIINI